MSGPAEFSLAALFFALVIVLNVLGIFRTFDSDEPQHLHVIWEWTRGFVQYRDIFDNHMPLFHIMFAPVAGMIGERATILYWMRFILLPMYFVSAWCVYQIGTRLFSRRAGIWAVLSLAFFGKYYSYGVLFRPDNLWTPLWLLCVMVLVRGGISPKSSAVAGLFLGLCFAVSMKSSFLLLSLLVSTPLAFALIGRDELRKSWTNLAKSGAIFLTVAATVPATIMFFFAFKGVWREFRYCVFEFNLLPYQLYEKAVFYKQHPALTVIIFLAALFAGIGLSRWIVRASRNSEVVFPRVLIFLICVVDFLALRLLWPPISRTYLPCYPLCFVLVTGALFALAERLAGQGRYAFRVFTLMPLPAILALAELFLLIGTRSFWMDRSKKEINLLRNVLALTESHDYVLDCKGEAIFRHRCFRPVLELITMKAIRRGVIVDDAPQRCIETRTCVVVRNDDRYSKSTREFIKRTYLPVTEELSVAGSVLEQSPATPGKYNFQVVIPAFYKIICRQGDVSGALDGTPYEGARFLASGLHGFETTSPSVDLVLLWAQAADRNFRPFDSQVSPDG